LIVFRWVFLVLAAMLTGPPAHTPTQTYGRSEQRISLTAPTVSVRGNHLISSKGKVVRMTGVNRSGAEYACAEGWGIWDGPTNTNSAVQAIAAWHVNAVRIPLNEDCWLGINGVKAATPVVDTGPPSRTM